MKTTDFIKESALVIATDCMERESEVQLARQDCHAIARGAIELYHILKDLPEMTDLDNQCVANLNMAAKFVEEALEYFDVVTRPAEGAFTFESAETLYNNMLSEGEPDAAPVRVGVEAYGVKGMKSTPWRKTFKSQQAFEKWLDANEGNIEVHGTREINLNDMFKEDATAGACASGSVAAVVGGLGETNDKTKLIKRQAKITNVLQSPKNVKVKGGY